MSAALFYAGQWLRLIEDPVKADAIIVLAGSFERSLHAADLYQQQFGPAVYLSTPAKEAGNTQIEALGIRLPQELEVHTQILLRKGVPRERILTFGSGSVSTAEEALELRKIFQRAGTKLLVVTSPYHVRRSRIILTRAFASSGIEITVVGTPYEPYQTDWWRTQDSARKTLLEIAKIVYYFAGGRFISSGDDN
jgi:uncharacterized SAM-binding protein YcdF (DUF218 family)